ncbi:hypothetical protein C5Y97_26210 [Blastopirellula marina]|uniref:Uncharacterized protein n=1 Tax=Blastopirellula marina TaxID=124 RepID=A0A2S8F6Q3_9BACT|nr:hypothetical protein C5Y98_26195 [Blastopirellula marina]PTL41558.1 hypothetical protein C5Y97_26210 [Blastopirellula marina]
MAVAFEDTGKMRVPHNRTIISQGTVVFVGMLFFASHAHADVNMAPNFWVVHLLGYSQLRRVRLDAYR